MQDAAGADSKSEFYWCQMQRRSRAAEDCSARLVQHMIYGFADHERGFDAEGNHERDYNCSSLDSDGHPRNVANES
jgi:hypothetical protein